VISTGCPPKGMTLADLGRKSIRRNALVADMCPMEAIDIQEAAQVDESRCGV
jgi:hypothetical protein